VITVLFILILLFKSLIIVFIFVFNIFFRVIIFVWLEISVSLGITWLPFVTESILGLTHLVVTVLEHGILIFSFVIEDLFLFCLLLLALELINNFLLMLSSIAIFNVVNVQFVLKIINVGVLLNVGVIETLQLTLQALVLFLVFWFDVFDSLESLLSSFELLLSTVKLVEKFTFIKFKLLHCIFHFAHFLGLIVNDVADTVLDVLLLGICVQVS
jgi:hypothetical protein